MYSEKIRNILEKNAKLSVPVKELSDESDLYNAGLSSLATVSVMLALEDEFDIELPDNMLSRKTFESIASIIEVVEELIE